MKKEDVLTNSEPLLAVTGSIEESPSANGGTIDLASLDLTGEIARLAYSYWEDRGGDGGSPEEDWFRAEHEVRVRAEERRDHGRDSLPQP